MEDNLASSVSGADCRYAYASVYVDTGGSSRVVVRLQDSLGLGGGGRYVTVGPVRVFGRHNDYATDRKAHPFGFLEWPTVLECEAMTGPPADVVAAIADVLEALWRGGFKALAACDFEDELPACGGRVRYPMPAAAEGTRALMGPWWESLVPFGKKER